MKRFIPRWDLVDTLDPATMANFITKFLHKVDECQTHPYYKPNLEKLGHEMLKAAFEMGLININQGCPGCGGGSCPSSQGEHKPTETNNPPRKGKVLQFKKLD
ncbi:hypothetical protein [Desulforamulus ferrireducens]|uniref:Uncharacterized protein n=1 Tax=Desulforamulus ferrireducens TaxID=1833852 RepID=A0A1S6IXN9_9FIRM|nr:hypothetical protein [Desulforamulus ferrireducens]AQS59522.1 hypothetical protein B0537_10780 [Desulforamulus ferrireducens]